MVTVYIYYISNDLNHDHHAVHKYVSTAMTHLQGARQLEPKHVIRWSDGCGAQYKSKGPFADLAASGSEEDYGIPFHQNYFGSQHGKGPCDR